jgi:hypothetical protein
MHQITKYVASDGKEFSTAFECSEYERLNPLRIAANEWYVQECQLYGIMRSRYVYKPTEQFLMYLGEKFLFTPKERTASNSSDDNR